jgi:hypothetical protein
MTKKEQQDIKKMKDEKKTKISKLQKKENSEEIWKSVEEY